MSKKNKKELYKSKSIVKGEKVTLKSICEKDVPDDLRAYFDCFYNIYKNINKARKIVRDETLDSLSLDELKDLNYKLYRELLNDNPLFVDKSDELHVYMSVLLYNLTNLTSQVFMNKDSLKFKNYKKFLIKILPFVKDKNLEKVKKIYNKYILDDRTLEIKVYDYVNGLYPNDNSFENFLINSEDLDNYDYLYKYGLYISDTELKIVDYFNKVDVSKIQDIAKTTIDGFLRGVESQNLDISKKTYVKLWYPLGYEKVALECQNYLFKKTGLTTLFNVIQSVPNKQIQFSHKNDCYLYLSNKFVDKNLEIYNKYFDDCSKEISSYAGRIFIETFGEKEFNPKKIHVVEGSEESISLKKDFDMKFNSLYREVSKHEETSFTIISYPSPEIDEENFEEIFDETIKLNTLDNDKWLNIQQKIIDALDEGSKVRVVGKNGNNTDIIVNLHDLKEGETNFENCTADVNIPVGEVFTSPVLNGTNGTLHVSKVYLRGLEYKNLSFTFKDGMVVDYNCSNFDNEKDNKDFVKENILHNYDSLPIGEFAIGTNTVAYVMARKYNIQNKLDILIAEKTGPHFAIGDTCYSHQEDLTFYNPDGKEIVAKENEVSALRKTDADKAYFYCHTDVTIPYDEVGGIYAVKDDGTEIPIIVDGKFVLEGTEDLNIEGI